MLRRLILTLILSLLFYQSAWCREIPEYLFSLAPEFGQQYLDLDLNSNPLLKKKEASLREKLGSGQLANGNNLSAAKNFYRCLELEKPQEAANSKLSTMCRSGYGRATRFSTSGRGVYEKLFSQRRPLAQEEDIEFSLQLLDEALLFQDVERANILIGELERALAKSSNTLFHFIFNLERAEWLIYQNDLDGSVRYFGEAQKAAASLTKLPMTSSLLEAIKVKLYVRKNAYSEAAKGIVAAENKFKFVQFDFFQFWWTHYGMMAGTYLNDRALFVSNYEKASRIIRGTENEPFFNLILAAWLKLYLRKEANQEIESIKKVLGPKSSLSVDLELAQSTLVSKFTTK